MFPKILFMDMDKIRMAINANHALSLDEFFLLILCQKMSMAHKSFKVYGTLEAGNLNLIASCSLLHCIAAHFPCFAVEFVEIGKQQLEGNSKTDGINDKPSTYTSLS